MAVQFKPDFQPVKRAQAKASVVIGGLSGRGKSGLAITLGYVLAGEEWDKVFALDTEHKSLRLFEGIPLHLGIICGEFMGFNLLRTHGFKPSHYIAAKERALEMGGKVFIQDSITHAWIGKGGVLDLVGRKEAANAKVNKFNAWNEREVVDEKECIYEMIRDPDMHIICAVRMKEKHDLKDGKVISLGEQQIQMPDLKYEPDLVLEMIKAGNGRGEPPRAKVVKSRYVILEEGEVYEFTKDLMIQLRDYLAEGADPAEMMEQQRQEFIREIKSILDSSASKRTVYGIIKADLKQEETPLDEMPLDITRKILGRLLN